MRAIILLIDGCGIGELPDAGDYNDQGSSTIPNIARASENLALPILQSLGLGNIVEMEGILASPSPRGSYGRLKELSPGKDSITGHWELMGVLLAKPFPVFPDGLPKEEMIVRLEEAIGKRTIGGHPCSGTVIINELGEEHIKTGCPIVYTSADSVFQIAAHKDVIPLKELYKICETARGLFPDIGRVIARPFIGTKGEFRRTPERRDFSLTPPCLTLLDILKEKGLKVTGIGKVDTLFGYRGFTNSIHTRDNREGMEVILKEMGGIEDGLIFSTLIDFDMLWGHRNDVRGFADGLMEFDEWLPSCISLLREDDILVITADHGNDPTTPSTDHSREYVPLLVMGKGIKEGVNLGTRDMTDLASTLADYFGVEIETGRSFLNEIFLGRR